MRDFLFSYGTLLPEHAPTEIKALVAKLHSYGEGFVRGVLFDFGEYPGVVLDDTSATQVSGTISRLPEDPNFLNELDRYEGFTPSSPGASLFVRKRHPVVLSDGSVLDCWIYEYNRKPGSAPIVASGRYRKAAVAKR